MANYSVIIRNGKTGIERKVDEIKAENQKEASKTAIRKWFTEMNMIVEQLIVVRQ